MPTSTTAVPEIRINGFICRELAWSPTDDTCSGGTCSEGEVTLPVGDAIGIGLGVGVGGGVGVE